MFDNILRKYDFWYYTRSKRWQVFIYWSSFVLTSMYAEVPYYEIKIGTGEWSMENNENAHFQ